MSWMGSSDVWMYLMYAVVMTSVTGALVTLLWYAAGRLLERLGCLRARCRLLRAALLFWFVPVIFLAEWYFGYVWKLWSYIFMPSPTIFRVSCLFAALWGIGVLVCTGLNIRQVLEIRRLLRDCAECGQWERRLLMETAREYGLSGKRMRVVRSGSVVTPRVAGLLHPTVFLPEDSYGEETLRVIFRHELMHVRQGDLWIRHALMLLCTLHFFNPAAWWYARILNKYSEFACDYRVCEQTRDLKGYYETILAMAENISSTKLASPLAERKCELRERMEHVMKCYTCKKNWKKRAAAAVLVGCMLLGGGGTVYAATTVFETVLPAWSKATEVAEEEPLQEIAPLVEYEEAYRADQRMVTGEVTAVANSTGASFSWNIKKGESYKSPAISVKKGKSIAVDVMITPRDTSVHVGIIKPNGSKIYVSGTRSISHDFEVSKTGTYYVYVENCGSKEIQVTGSYDIE